MDREKLINKIKKDKFPIIILAVVVVLIFGWLITGKVKTWLFYKQAPKENFVKCEIGGNKKIFQISSSLYAKSLLNSTILTANETVSNGSNSLSTLKIILPGNTMGHFEGKAKSSNSGIYYTDSSNNNYETFSEDKGSQIDVTEYSGNNVQGNFSGTGVLISNNQPDTNHKIEFQNCSFSSNLEMKKI